MVTTQNPRTRTETEEQALERERLEARGYSTTQQDRTFGDGHRPRSIPDLLRDLTREGSTLVRQEIELAKTEVSENASRGVRNTVYIASGGLIMYAGFLVLLIAASVGLGVALAEAGVEESISGWLGPLIVGGLVFIVGAALFWGAKAALEKQSLAPEKTQQSLKETARWAKDEVSR